MSEHVHGDECVGTLHGKWICEMDRAELLSVVQYLSDRVRSLERSNFETHDLLRIAVRR